MAASHRMRLFAPTAVTSPRASGWPREATEAEALLVPALVLFASAMVTSALSSGFDTLYPLRVGATALALWHFRAAYRRLDWCWTWQSAAIGGGVFLLWLALEAPAGGQGGSIKGALTTLAGRGRPLARVPDHRLRNHGAAGRGTRLPRLPDP